MEMSPFPERALGAADTLQQIIPDGFHLLHMASHIDVACGDYCCAMISNHCAMRADDSCFTLQPHTGSHTMYHAHNAPRYTPPSC